MRTRSTSKLINVINDDNDQISEHTNEEGSVSGKDINPINTKHWKTSSKLYYQRPTTLDLLLEERGKSNFIETVLCGKKRRFWKRGRKNKFEKRESVETYM